jgi:multiple sugar transport system permease protein
VFLEKGKELLNKTQSIATSQQGFHLSRRAQQYILFIILVVPAIILRFATAAYPMAKTVQLSLKKFEFYGTSESYVGFQNFQDLPDDFGFNGAIEFTILFVIFSTLLQLILGLMIAQLLNAKFKGRWFARTVNLIPWAIPTIVVAYAFRWILDDQFGMITHWIDIATGTRPVIFIDPIGSRVAVILVNVWKNAPFMAIVFLAGLQGIPEDLYDAGKVDGTNARQRFFYITLPMIIPLVVTMSTFFIIWQVASLDLIYGLTSGGPGVATQVLAMLVYEQGLRFFNYGFASAISMVLLFLVGIIGMIGIILFRRFEVSY